jgi:predicted  nucleic acid-binding Zn-ribbon protein
VAPKISSADLLREHGEQIVKTKAELAALVESTKKLDTHMEDLARQIVDLNRNLSEMPSRMQAAVAVCLKDDRKSCQRHVAAVVFGWIFAAVLAVTGALFTFETVFRK